MTASCAKLTIAGNHHTYSPGSGCRRQEHLRRDAVLHMPHHILWTRQTYTPGPSVRLPEATSPLSLAGNSSNDTDMMSPLSSSPVSHSIQIFTTGSSQLEHKIVLLELLCETKFIHHLPWPLVNMELSKFSFQKCCPSLLELLWHALIWTRPHKPW